MNTILAVLVLLAQGPVVDTVDVGGVLGLRPPYRLTDSYGPGRSILLEGSDSTLCMIRLEWLVVRDGDFTIVHDWEERMLVHFPVVRVLEVIQFPPEGKRGEAWRKLAPLMAGKTVKTLECDTAEGRAVTAALDRLAREALIGVDIERVQALRDSAWSWPEAETRLEETLTGDQIRALELLWMLRRFGVPLDDAQGVRSSRP
jgi:hypothetical protein